MLRSVSTLLQCRSSALLSASIIGMTSQRSISSLTIVGGGSMGSGIAQVSATAGLDVAVVDIDQSCLDRTKSIIESSLARVVKKKFADDPIAGKRFAAETLSRIVYSLDVDGQCASRELVLEAIVENLEVKRQLFERLDGVCPPTTIFASNTSSLPIAEIAAVTKRGDKFGGLHFFNPVPMMKLLEVVRTDDTSQQTFDALMNYAKSVGKVPVKCKDTPGFIVNRLLIPYMAQAIQMSERGDASQEDIDVAMKLGAGYPMGPFELCDYVGVDVIQFVLSGWHKRFPNDPTFAPSDTLNRLVKEGKLGRKTGEGFYKYDKK